MKLSAGMFLKIATAAFATAVLFGCGGNGSVAGGRNDDYPTDSDKYTLTVYAGEGGTVSRNPGKASYDAGEQVTVTAIPNPNSGYTFAYWSGDGDMTIATNPLTVTMTRNLTLAANFQYGENPPAPQCDVSIPTIALVGPQVININTQEVQEFRKWMRFDGGPWAELITYG
ncbi:MAG: InlB B-repeat-containing protein, partial [Chitinispirillales bacterium]|nr:InlB B-repeat-containing protein [Chitinispirillales bacterium]